MAGGGMLACKVYRLTNEIGLFLGSYYMLWRCAAMTHAGSLVSTFISSCF